MHSRRRSRSREDAKNEKKIKLYNNSGNSNRTRTKILIRHNFGLRRLCLRELSSFEQKSTKHRFGLYTRKHNVVVCMYICVRVCVHNMCICIYLR